MKKFNLLLPIAGRGNRFVEKGYTIPKPLIKVTEGKTLVEKSLESVNIENARLIFIVRQEHIDRHQLDEKLLKAFPRNKVVIVPVDYDTEGALCSCMLAKEYIDEPVPLVVFTPDCLFEPAFNMNQVDSEADGAVAVFGSNSPAHSYVVVSEEGNVVRAAEKEVISDYAVAGLYYFKSGEQFVKHASTMINLEKKSKGEYYICPLYNLFIDDGDKIVIEENTVHHILGTPEGLEEYKAKVRK